MGSCMYVMYACPWGLLPIYIGGSIYGYAYFHIDNQALWVSPNDEGQNPTGTLST